VDLDPQPDGITPAFPGVLAANTAPRGRLGLVALVHRGGPLPAAPAIPFKGNLIVSQG
jgi:hypothetical protein